MMVYDPHNWFWIVGGDESRAWSSAALAYVSEWPMTRTTRIASETELNDVLRLYGLIGPLLSVSKMDVASRIDADAETARLQFVTPGAGMAMTYQEKFAQAQAVAAMGETDANAMNEMEREEQFPTLAASVGIEADMLWDCAQLVLQKYTAFAQLSLVIERTRLAGKKAISDASDAAGVRAAYEAITWPTP